MSTNAASTRNSKPVKVKLSSLEDTWRLRDSLASAALFLATAAVTLWQNAHLTVLWDASYTLDTSSRIALGQMPYRDFPLAHAPLTFLIQAAIIRLAGRVFFHHVLYAAIAGGLGTVLAWRIVLGTLRARVHGSWLVSLLLAAPLTVLGIYSILPFPSYDCDCVFSILLVIYLLQRIPANSGKTLKSSPATAPWRPFLAGATLPLPLFFKQNIGLPLLASASAFILLLLIVKRARRGSSSEDSAELLAVLSGAVTSLFAVGLLLRFTCGLGSYIQWTIHFASQRRLPGFEEMLGVYAEPSLLWWLPAVAGALVLLYCRYSKALLVRLSALVLLAAPFIWTLAGLLLSTDADDRASSLLALWPLLMILSASLTLFNLWHGLVRDRERSLGLRALLPAILLVTINGTLLSQQLWGSTYAIWPLLVLLIAEMIVFLSSIESSGSPTETTHRTPFVAPVLSAIISATLLLCGGLYMVSEERLSYANIEGPVVHSAEPALRGIAVAGPFLPEFEELLHFAANEIPVSDGVLLIPGEDPFYFATGRVPQFPVLLFDKATDPFSPSELLEEAKVRKLHWLIVKRDLQIKEDPTPQREASLEALQRVFFLYRKLGRYDVYRRP
ncbi:MAG: hypothetical protein ABSB60_09970 [Terracidiphilus sp.]